MCNRREAALWFEISEDRSSSALFSGLCRDCMKEGERRRFSAMAGVAISAGGRMGLREEKILFWYKRREGQEKQKRKRDQNKN